jgi:S1-C subfamily serine protease
VRLLLQRLHGKFGMQLDNTNRVMLVRPDSAAERCGLRVGDVVVTCDGQPLAGELSQAMHGKERAELGVRRTGPS